MSFRSPADDDELVAYLEHLKRLERMYDEAGEVAPLYPWQRPPEGDWFGWAMVGGRGIGKTFAGATWVNAEAMANPGIRVAIVAPTRPDASATCVEGETGLLRVNPAIRFNRSRLELRWPNGSTARLFGAYTPEDRERLRGPQYHIAWLEEFAAWRQLDEHPRDDNPDLWQHLTFGLRLGERPRFFMSSTPKRRRRFRELLDRDDVMVTRASTYDATGLPEIVRQRYLELYEGTRLGQQELLGEILDDVEGALWTEANIVENRVLSAPDLARVIVGVDPAGSSRSGTVGIVAVGVSDKRFPHPATGRGVRHLYVLEDASLSGPPEQWARRAVDLASKHGAERIVAEPNFGGEMVQAVIRQVDPAAPLKMVHSARGKRLRAEPVAAVSAQGLLHLVGGWPELEEQMTGWVEGQTPWSPDRLDAMVFAATDLLDHVRGVGGVHSPGGSITGGPRSATTRQALQRISR